MALVTERCKELAAVASRTSPRARHLEEQDLFPLDPSHRRGIWRDPEPLLDLPVAL